MNKQELYQIAFSIINHKKLRNFGTGACCNMGRQKIEATKQVVLKH